MRSKIVVFLVVLFASLGSSLGAQARYYTETNLAQFTRYPPFLEPIVFGAIDYPRLHAAMHFETNKARVAQGLRELPYAQELETAAYHHSRVMVELQFFDHQSKAPGRVGTADRGRLAGISNPFLAENIAISFGIQYQAGRGIYTHGPGKYSYDNNPANAIPNHTYLSFAQAVVLQWMNSPGHRANILSTNAIAMGNGAYFDTKSTSMPQFKATQNFQWYEAIVPGTRTDSLVPQATGTPLPQTNPEPSITAPIEGTPPVNTKNPGTTPPRGSSKSNG